MRVYTISARSADLWLFEPTFNRSLIDVEACLRGGCRSGRYGEKYYAIAIKRKIQSANGRGILIKPPLYCRLFIDKRTRNEGLYRLV